MRSFVSITPVDKNPTIKSYFWRRIPIDVRVKATYDSYRPNSFLTCYGIIFAFNLGIWGINITDYRWLVTLNILDIMVILA